VLLLESLEIVFPMNNHPIPPLLHPLNTIQEANHRRIKWPASKGILIPKGFSLGLPVDMETDLQRHVEPY
jgi:hypothetical protein